MRNLAGLVPALAIAACAAAPASNGPATAAPATDTASASGGECSATGTSGFIGQQRSPETQAAILAATGSAQIRWVPHGSMVTMEFLSTRVTVYQGPDNRIERIVCG